MLPTLLLIVRYVGQIRNESICPWLFVDINYIQPWVEMLVKQCFLLMIRILTMGNFDRKSLLLLTGGCAVAAFGVWLGSIAGGFWALALVGLSVCGVVALGLRGLLHRLSGQTLMVDGILLVGILACLSLEQSALVVNMVFAALAVFLCADVAAWRRSWLSLCLVWPCCLALASWPLPRASGRGGGLWPWFCRCFASACWRLWCARVRRGAS